MFKNLRIRNFRAFDDLEIPRLGRINLVTGKNNSGKTSLLEAFFLLCGAAGNPNVALNANRVRGIDFEEGLAVWETFWKPIFTAFDIAKIVEIEGLHESQGFLTLNIATEHERLTEVPIENLSRTLETEFLNRSSLRFSLKKDSNKEWMDGRIRLAGKNFQIDTSAVSTSTLPFQAVFLSSRIGNLQEDAQRLGQLRQQKRGELVVSALRIVEPRLQSVEVNSASGVPMIWGDIGLPELVPLPMMGEGMTRIARLILAISAAPGGVVLVDEVENGLHYSALGKVWKAIGEAARQFNTQVVASTHSFECMEAAHQSLDAEDFLVHRLENSDEAIRCITLESEQIRATVEHNLEIR